MTHWAKDVETKLKTAGKLPCSIESTNPETTQQICTTVDITCFYVREVYTAKELQTDCNYKKLWSSFKLLQYLNDPFLNLIPREQLILVEMLLISGLSFIIPLVVFNNN